MASDSTPTFISELKRAADATSNFTDAEIALLLHRAAATIRNYRVQVRYYEDVANDLDQGDIAFELNAMASAVELFPREKVSAMLLEVIGVINDCRTFIEAKRKV
ncbi:hypothetical protein [Aminobacter sp. LjRoot7]|uniref:hypothetical protein n=1 Tax=Aminobacter sp. LjRoot7 TaxID=3342335 RepID=UPI003ED11BC6